MQTAFIGRPKGFSKFSTTGRRLERFLMTMEQRRVQGSERDVREYQRFTYGRRDWRP